MTAMACGVAAYLDDLRWRGGDGERGGLREAAAAAKTAGGRALNSWVLAARVRRGDPTAVIIWTIAWRMTGGAV
jgi:hypothetical protein